MLAVRLAVGAPLGRLALAAFQSTRVIAMPMAFAAGVMARSISSVSTVAAAAAASSTDAPKAKPAAKPKAKSAAKPKAKSAAKPAVKATKAKKAAPKAKKPKAQTIKKKTAKTPAAVAATQRAEARAALRARRQERANLIKTARAERRAARLARTQARREKQAKEKQEKRVRVKARRDESRDRLVAIAKKRQELLAERRARHPRRAKLDADPTMPRRPLSAYATFFKSRYDAVRTAALAALPAGEKLKIAVPAKLLAQEWKNLPADEKAKIVQTVERAKAEYEQKRKQHELTQAPKRPMGGYIRFFTENHGRVARANPGKPVHELTTIVANEWKSLPDSERAAINAKAQGEFESWKLSLKDWQIAHPDQPVNARARLPSIKDLVDEIKTKRAKQQAARPKTKRTKTEETKA